MLLSTLAGFFVTPFLLKHLGVESFGLWVLLLSIVGYMTLLEVGLYTTIAKRVAECLAKDDHERLECVLSTALALYLALSVLVLFIGLILVALVDRLFHLPPQSTSVARSCLFLLVLNQMLLFGFRLQPSLLFGAGRADLLTGVGTVYNLSTAALNVILAALGFGIEVLAAGTLLTTTISGIIGRRLIQRHLPPLRIQLRLARMEMARELLKFGSRNATLSIAARVAFGADALVIGLLLPVANVAHYTVAARLANVSKELCHKPVDVLMPAYAHGEAQGDMDRHFRLWSESAALSLAIALPFVIAACGFGERLVAAWVGPGHEISGAIFGVLVLMQWLQLPGHASIALLTGTERNLLMVRLIVVAAICNLALSIALTKLLGPIGVALASLIVVTVVDFTLLPLLVCRQFGFAALDFWRQSLWPLLVPLIAGVITAGCGLWLHQKYFAVPPGRFASVVLLMLVCAACWTAWLRFGLDATRQQKYFASLRGAVRR
jgi:O-antigen/teichoic acid export membrane protein